MYTLILLMGSNPIPNYIIAKYLTEIEKYGEVKFNIPDLIVFVHTSKTARFARQIQSVLNLSSDFEIQEVKLDEDGRKPKIIRKKIIEKLDEIRNNKKIISIHLNYIGGTKTMAVQTTKAVEKWVQDHPEVDCLVSDVDPKNHKIILSDNGIGYPIIGDLRERIKLSINELLQLHNMEINDGGKNELSVDELDLILFCKELLNKYQSDEEKTFSKKMGEYGRKYNNFAKGRNDNEKERKIVDNPGYFNQLKKNIYTKLPVLKKINLNCTSDTQNVCFFDFVFGGWLEELIQKILLNLKQEVYPEVYEIRRGVKAEYDNRTTEIDVIAIQGYQLYLFSCTTANKIQLVKQKTFEAIYRAEQLGGEHAKVIVVSTMYNDYNHEDKDSDQNIHNLRELKKDLSQFDATRNCSLIGINELAGEIKGKNTLTNRIKYILEGGQ